MSLYHSWFFRDAILLKDGGPTIDLLDGGTIGAGGQARHTVQLNAGLIDNGVGLRLSGNWKSATRVRTDAGSAAGDLRFHALATFDLRLFAELANRFPGRGWARGTRVSLTLGNVLNTRQRVTDATGATPLLYQPDAIDPYGRTINLSVRRRL
ncbi:TonB-dependent receptor, plug [Sphingomonas sp. RIT328]|nr:TonB-dependent receptor, plug [Sphingomonas sp. RIT328]